MRRFGSQFLSLDDLFIHEIHDLYDAEKRMLKALPKMRDKAHAEALKQIFEAHFAQTLQHVKRLDEVFLRLNHAPDRETSEGMKSLLNEGDEMVGATADPDVRDAALIAAAQRLEHYEIAGYGTACTFAFQLGETEIADLLHRTLQEEMAADKKLTEVAEAEVNARAAE